MQPSIDRRSLGARLADQGEGCHPLDMRMSFRRLSVFAILLASGCAAEEPCDPPPAHWAKSAPADAHRIVVDRHDRVFWNGAIISRERLRNPLNRADADGRAVQLAPAPGARCAMVDTIRLAMERALDCRSGRCAEAAPANSRAPQKDLELQNAR